MLKLKGVRQNSVRNAETRKCSQLPRINLVDRKDFQDDIYNGSVVDGSQYKNMNLTRMNETENEMTQGDPTTF